MLIFWLATGLYSFSLHQGMIPGLLKKEEAERGEGEGEEEVLKWHVCCL